MSNEAASSDHYGTLGVERDVDPKTLKRRFLALAREQHPDRFAGAEKVAAEAAFQAITEAYNVLSDPLKRRQYDVESQRPERQRNDPGQLARAYLVRGAKAYREGHRVEAASHFHSATQAMPSDPSTWYHLALACADEKRYAKRAQEAVERAVELAPTKGTYLKLAGRIYAQNGLVSRAKEYYNRALRSGGSDAAVRKALADLEGPGDPSAESKPKSGIFRKLW